MAEGYSWSESRERRVFRLPHPDHLGWWAAAAMIFSILLHVVVFFALDRMKIAFKFEEARELSTRSVDVRQLEIRPYEPDESKPPEDVIKPPTDTAALLDEVELLAILPKNQQIDIKPEILEAEYAIRMQNPAKEGRPDAIALELSAGLEIDAELPDLGRESENIKPAEVGQITVDPGAVQTDDQEIGKFTDDLIKKGANGKVEKGTLDGITSLDKLLDLPPNLIISKKTMLPSDLLFEFNSAALRESAKVGLMKLTLLMDRNPGLYCWIEGHTDLVGGDEFNLKLSIDRAEAVKFYLVNSYKMDASKIVTRGFGRHEPIVTVGDAKEQSINRRVEIRMRQTQPTKTQMKIEPKKAAVIEETPAPQAVLVKPKRAIPLEETPLLPKATPVEETPPLPRATPVEEPPQLPRATPVEEEPPLPRATPVEEEPPLPRATPVEEAPIEEAPPLRAQPAFPEIPQAIPIDPEEP